MRSGGRSIPTGRAITILPAAVQPDGQNSRNVPDDLNQLWTGKTQPGESAGAMATRHIPRAIVLFPPEYLQPPEATPFNPYGIAASVGAGTQYQLWQFVVPKSSILIIKDLDFYSTNTTAATQLTFGIFQNGAPYGQYGAIPLFAGVAAVNARSFSDITFRFPEATVVTCVATNTDGAAYQIAASAQGWYYTRTVADQYKFNIGQP